MTTAIGISVAVLAILAWFWVSIAREDRRIQRMRDDVAIRREVERAKRLGWWH
jgi:hypothetical protein